MKLTLTKYCGALLTALVAFLLMAGWSAAMDSSFKGATAQLQSSAEIDAQNLTGTAQANEVSRATDARWHRFFQLRNLCVKKISQLAVPLSDSLIFTCSAIRALR